MIAVADYIDAPRPALQDRSRRTVEVLTRAALRLLRAAEFDELAVSEIVAAANSSVGSFYARFPSKEDLLFHLAEHILHEDIAPGAEVQMSPERLRDARVEARMHAALTYMADVFVRHRRILRPLTIQMHTAKDRRFKEAARRFNEPVHRAFCTLMAVSPELADAPDLHRKLDDVLLWSGASLRQTLLLRDPPNEGERRRAVSRLAKCMAAYLLCS